jgi:O-antigen/teichoic acid export membrane protein
MMIAGKSFITKENPVAVLGILMIGNLVNGMFGLAGPLINGLGRSKFMFFMNVVSLVFAITLNYILIPRLGIAGAALSSMGYQVMQAIWLNIYVYRMLGFWPYKKSLWIQVLWITLLTVLYVVLNTGYNPGLLLKGFYYGIAIVLILATFYFQGIRGKKPVKKQ